MIDMEQCSVELLQEHINNRSIKELRHLFDELNIIDMTEPATKL